LKENGTRKYKWVVDKLPAVISSTFLLAAVFGRWPYGFYTFVRLIVCGCAVYLAVRTKTVRSTAWPWILGGMAVLFNPIVPMRMHRSDWRIIDLIAAAVLFAFLVWDCRRTYSPG